MKVAARRGIWRPLRCFVILLCVGGAVTAADNSWITSLPFEEFSLDEWYDSLVGPETREAKVKSPEEPAIVAETQSSISRWNDRSLFYQPSNGWMLDTVRSASMPVSKIESYSAPMTFAQSIAYSAAPSSTELVRNSTVASPLVPSSPTATDGTWTSNASGNWGTAANWQSNVIADGAGATAHFDVTNISTNVTVTLDTSRTIGNLYIGDTDGSHSYTISATTGSTLTFDSNAPFTASTLEQTPTSAGDTIGPNIFVKNTLDINNLSSTKQLTITGNIASSASSGSFQNIFFNNPTGATGDISVSGNISNGSTGAHLSVILGQGGTVTLTGTNTYTGSTEIENGTLLINGDNSGANGGVFVDNGGTLGGHGKIGGNTNVFGGTVTGDTTTTVGTLTMTGNLTFGGEGPGGTYLANLSGSLSDLLAITGSLIIFGETGLTIVGSADNIHTYILATFHNRSGVFDPALVTGIPSGYTLVYNATDIELVPTAIPEPATWLGGALALGAIAFVSRKRLRFHRA